VDEDDAGVEIPALAGDPLIDLVGHGMRHPPPACGLAHELQALAQGRLGEHVEEAEAHDDLPSPRVSTSPVISACALIACQSGYCTGLSKLVTWEM
jgi:hypothetical protein